MSWLSRENRKRQKADFQRFLTQAQSHKVGGFYEQKSIDRPVEFIRPLKCPFVRVKDIRSKEKRNVSFRDLEPMNEMKVLVYMTWTEEDERKAQEEERLRSSPAVLDPSDDEPQEPGDCDFLR